MNWQRCKLMFIVYNLVQTGPAVKVVDADIFSRQCCQQQLFKHAFQHFQLLCYLFLEKRFGNVILSYFEVILIQTFCCSFIFLLEIQNSEYLTSKQIWNEHFCQGGHEYR